MQGNLRSHNEVYISVSSMERFAEQLKRVNTEQGILITPYLLVEGGMLYELHYYEFDIEVRGSESYYKDYNARNSLPSEITENLKPQAIIAVGDKESYVRAVKEYLENMNRMKFAEEKDHYPELKKAQLCYQIFRDSDLD